MEADRAVNFLGNPPLLEQRRADLCVSEAEDALFDLLNAQGGMRVALFQDLCVPLRHGALQRDHADILQNAGRKSVVALGRPDPFGHGARADRRRQRMPPEPLNLKLFGTFGLMSASRQKLRTVMRVTFRPMRTTASLMEVTFFCEPK